VNDSLEARRQRLAETIAWCNWQRLINKPIESEEIKQRRALGERAANHAFAAHQLESASLFKWINRKKVKTMRDEALRMYREARLEEIRPLAPQLRTPSLKPAEEFSPAQTAERRTAIVEAICSTRLQLLQEKGISVSATDLDLSGGRILLYSYDDNDESGAAGYPSKGFFNVEAAPPWDTWVCYAGRQVVAYIPPVLWRLAQDGMDVDPVECIRWADTSTLFKCFGIQPIP
jgi:hypothetical protein